MGDALQLSRRSLRRDQILEIQWPSMPEPPPALMRIPGFAEYHAGLKLHNERTQAVFDKLINNLGVATSTP